MYVAAGSEERHFHSSGFFALPSSGGAPAGIHFRLKTSETDQTALNTDIFNKNHSILMVSCSFDLAFVIM
jgi:hypothetical protein